MSTFYHITLTKNILILPWILILYKQLLYVQLWPVTSYKFSLSVLSTGLLDLRKDRGGGLCCVCKSPGVQEDLGRISWVLSGDGDFLRLGWSNFEELNDVMGLNDGFGLTGTVGLGMTSSDDDDPWWGWGLRWSAWQNLVLPPLDTK